MDISITSTNYNLIEDKGFKVLFKNIYIIIYIIIIIIINFRE